MDYNQYNQNVPPYPQPSFDFRETKPTYVEKGKILNKPLDWYNQNQTRPIPNGFVVIE